MSRYIDADKLKGEINTAFWSEIGKIIDSAPTIKTKQIKYFDEDEQVWKIGEVIVNSSEKPNNSEIPTGSERSSE